MDAANNSKFVPIVIKLKEANEKTWLRTQLQKKPWILISMICAIIMVPVLSFASANLVADLLYNVFNPRIWLVK